MEQPPSQTVSPPGIPPQEAMGTPRVLTFVLPALTLEAFAPTDAQGYWTVKAWDANDDLREIVEGKNLRQTMHRLIDIPLSLPDKG